MSQSTLRRIFQCFRAFDLEEKTVRDFLSKSSKGCDEIDTFPTARRLSNYVGRKRKRNRASRKQEFHQLTFSYDITQSPP